MKLGTDKKQLGRVMLHGCRCRCGHEWLPRPPENTPKVCPKCKSPNWSEPKREIKSILPKIAERGAINDR